VEEMAKILAGNRTQHAMRMQTSMARATSLGEATVFFNDPDLVNSFERKYEAVKQEDLLRVANAYLKDTSRTVVTTVPKPKTMPAAVPASK
jgi:predicted Zn-dependent peptidase